ncbi:MAG: hypothetical protein ACRDIC_21280 [bacterium]
MSTLLSDTELFVEPGGNTVCEIQLGNTGDVVDQFAIEVIGATADWATVEPPLVNLLPGDEETIRVTFRPPRNSDVLAGVIPFAIRVKSREDPHGSRVDEGEIEVGPFVEIATELIPAKKRGRRRAKFRLAIDNLANHDVGVSITPIAQDDECEVRVRQQTVTIAPGTASFIQTAVIPHKKFFRGEPKSHEFQLVVRPVDEEHADKAAAADGVMVQERLIPKLVFTAFLIALAGLAVLVALWFTLLKPTVESAARGQAKKEVENASTAAARANEAADKADQAAEQAVEAAQPTAGNGAGADQNGQAGAGSDGATGTGPGTNGAGSGASGTTTFRIETKALPSNDGSFETFAFVTPDDQTLEIVDVVLQNPRGDSGFMRIAVGDQVVLEVGLANFRDLDYHYIVPLKVGANQPLRVLVNCTTPGINTPQCTPSASFSGRLSKP